MRSVQRSFLVLAAGLLLAGAAAADVRIRQKVTMGGQTMESTRSIKGARERTETKIQTDNPQAAAYMPQVATITQCDLKRTVRINEKSKLYMLDPFATAADATPVKRTTPEPTQRTTTTRQGGTVTITYSVRDTGERKTMFGLQARRLVVTNEMESSADSCNGPRKTKMEYDGWYVDFSAEFNCPQATPDVAGGYGGGRPDCTDRVVTKGNGTAPKGFLIEGTMRIFGPDGSVQMTHTTETLELSRAPLDAALFDIPAGYREVASSQELYAMPMPSMESPVARERSPGSRPANQSGSQPATPATKTVAVNITGGNPSVQAEVEQYIRQKIAERGLRAGTGTGDYALNFEFRQVKESAAGKIGGIFGKVTGVEAKVGKVDIDLAATLSGGATGQAKVKSKFDGPMSDALRAAVDQALDQLLAKIEN